MVDPLYLPSDEIIDLDSQQWETKLVSREMTKHCSAAPIVYRN